MKKIKLNQKKKPKKLKRLLERVILAKKTENQKKKKSSKAETPCSRLSADKKCFGCEIIFNKTLV